MTPLDVLDALKAIIPERTPLEEALSNFITHFDSTEIDGCAKEDDGDMLLFQWGGPYSWDPHFSINLTRQFSHKDENGDYVNMEQLHMNCRYEQAESWPKAGNQWYKGSDIQDFINAVLTSSAVKAAHGGIMISLDFDLHDV